MPYHQLETPSATHPHLVSIVRDQIDPLLRDVHALLRLPIPNQPGLDAKGNFSAALILLGVVAGVSAMLYDDTVADSARFRGH